MSEAKCWEIEEKEQSRVPTARTVIRSRKAAKAQNVLAAKFAKVFHRERKE